MINKRLCHVVLIVFACFSGQANADIPPSKVTTWNQWWTSPEGACQWIADDSRYNSPNPVYFRFDSATLVSMFRAQCNGVSVRRSDDGNDVVAGPAAGIYVAASGFECPFNSTHANWSCKCIGGAKENASKTACVNAPPELPLVGNSCKASTPAGASTPFPILPASGEKFRSEVDFADHGPAALSLARIYRSSRTLSAPPASAGLGSSWSHNHSMTLQASPAHVRAAKRLV